jgi:hypothetical protein
LTTTCAPSPASLSTVARPILRPDPVTSATFPSSLPMPPSPLRFASGSASRLCLCSTMFQNRAFAATLEANRVPRLGQRSGTWRTLAAVYRGTAAHSPAPARPGGIPRPHRSSRQPVTAASISSPNPLQVGQRQAAVLTQKSAVDPSLGAGRPKPEPVVDDEARRLTHASAPVVL